MSDADDWEMGKALEMANDEAAGLRRLAREALELLREREWHFYRDVPEGVYLCRDCQPPKSLGSHTEDCRLARVLRELEEVAGG